MNIKHVWALPLLGITVAAACGPNLRRSNDDDDGGENLTVGSGPTTGATSGTGGAGGSTNVTNTGVGGNTSTTTTVSATTTTTTTTGGGLGICGSELSFQNAALDGCITGSCCTQFNACIGNSVCESCLTGPTSGCESNSLYNAFLACSDSACPTDMCDTGIGFTDTATQDPIFACNSCADSNCCVGLLACVGGQTQNEINTCLDCLNDPSSANCTTAPTTVQNGAVDFNDCIGTTCSAECS